MSWDMPGIKPDFIAGAAIGANLLVKGGAADFTVIQTTAITDVVVGVSALAAASGDAVALFTVGSVARVVSGAAITRWTRVMPEGAGTARVITWAGAGSTVVGIALEDSTAAGQIISVLLTLSGTAAT